MSNLTMNSASPKSPDASLVDAQNSSEDVYIFPASFAQERLWFLDQLDLGNPVYNVPGNYPFTGPLNVAALQRALDALIERHEILRTTFSAQGGIPKQRVSPSLQLAMRVVDLSELSESTRPMEVQRLYFKEATHKFDLAHGPLLRVLLLHLGDLDHVFILTLHHIIADAWSLDIFFNELNALYRAFSAGRPSSLAELPLQYADYCQWQRDNLQGQVLEDQLSYWRDQFRGAPQLIELPTDRPRPATQKFQGYLHSFIIPLSLARQLKQLGKRADANLFMTLLAAFKLLLARYSGQSSVVVGTPIANRPRKELEGLIGFFVNTLALHTEIDERKSFLDLLRAVRETILGAYAHQDLPFERLVEELTDERQLGHNPLFQVMFVYQCAALLDVEGDAGQETLEQSSLPGVSDSGPTGTAKFDLTLFVTETQENLMAAIEFDVALFDGSSIVQLANNFVALLGVIVAEQQRPLIQLPLLPEDARNQILYGFNDNTVDYGPPLTLHQWVERQADKSPMQAAVVSAEQSLSYRELNCRANRLAHYLVQCGVRPEMRVGIFLARNASLAVALLAILKSGGAYVPLDASLPKKRLAYMIQDARLAVVVSDQEHIRELPGSDRSDGSLKCICIDRDYDDFQSLPDTNPETSVGPEHPAYAIYTSGSTGQPKGVEMTHGPLSNLMSWQVGSVALAAEARTLQFSSPNFDVSCQEIFSTWAAGGTLVFADEDTRRDIRRLWRFIIDQDIARVFLPPAVLQQLAEVFQEFSTESVPVAHFIVAGEPLQITQAIIALFTQFNKILLHNHYGPTETHLTTTFVLDPANPWMLRPPIGQPIANVHTYVLDRFLEPVPIGVPGELYIGGAGLARDYLNRPGTTAEHFIPCPFGETRPGARLYKTGDRVRYRPDGNIEFLSRLDNQVKIRGFRVELGEVESVLAQHPRVGELAVVARPDTSGNQRLIAYFVAKPAEPGRTAGVAAAAPSTTELRHFLLDQLPEYMVPSAFVLLERLPLSSNGKMDLKALPDPEGDRPVLAASFKAPSGEIEMALAAIWREVLDLTEIGVDDNFFELGGHSLLATQVVSRVRDQVHLELPLRWLFEAPTIAGIAERLLASRKEGSSQVEANTIPQADRGTAAALLERLDQLSDAEVEALLSEI